MDIKDVRFLDEKGYPYGIKQTGNKPRVSSMPYLYDIAEGNVENHYLINKFGYNDAVAAAWEEVWTGSTAYTFPSAATHMTLSSSDTDDTAAGAEARTVECYGLDENYNEVQQIVTLNGQTGVQIGLKLIRIYRMIVRSAGTTGYNEGVIYAGTGAIAGGVPANIYARIEIARCQTLMAIWTVPANHTMYLINYGGAEVAAKQTEFNLMVRPFEEVFQVKHVSLVKSFRFDHDYKIPLRILEKSDIVVRAYATGAGGAVSAHFSGWYEEN